MTEKREPIGYLMGYPIYLDDNIKGPEGTLYFRSLDDWNKEQQAKATAANVADDMVRNAPPEAI